MKTICALCFGQLDTVIQLTPTPPANELLLSPNKDQDVFDLNLMKCSLCNHLQLDTEVNKNRLFENYVYVSDTGQSNRDHFKKYADQMTSLFHPKFVVDIGSNDGLFLSYFNCEVLGVDPANVEKKVETIESFFTQEIAKDIENSMGKADLITANNIFAHNKNLANICKGVKKLLSEDGTFVFEVSYAMKMLKHSLFDLVYHEHYHHWHVNPMIQFFNRFGLTVIDAQMIDTHGGSIRVYVKHDHHKSSARLEMLLREERKYFNLLLQAFKFNVLKNKVKMDTLLSNLNNIGILGYPAKACTLSYYYNLQDKVSNVYDDNELKIGKYTQQGLQIKNTKEIYNDNPEYLLILSWNYAKQLMDAHKDFKGKFIIPFPEPKVI